MLSPENLRQMEKLSSSQNPDQSVKNFLAGKSATPFESSSPEKTQKTEEEVFSQKQSRPERLGPPETLSAEELKQLEKQYNDEVEKASACGEYAKLGIEDCEKISPEALKEKRVEFNRIKEELIKEWGEKNGTEWPRYEEDVYSEYGKKIRSKGDRYDAHHVQPLELGGKNTTDNLTPMHAHDHYDKQGIHRPGSPYAAIVNEKKNAA